MAQILIFFSFVYIAHVIPDVLGLLNKTLAIVYKLQKFWAKKLASSQRTKSYGSVKVFTGGAQIKSESWL